MLLPPFELNERIRVLRLYSGLNQAEMAQMLGMTQSWLSKLESGIGELNASHLLLLKNKFNITADCILDGAIPYAAIAKSAKATLRMPKKYLREANSRVRMLYGFVSLLEAELGEESVREYFRTISVPTEILADPNTKINLILLFDLIAFGIEKGVLTKNQAWEHVARANLTPLALGAAHARLVQTKSPLERIEKLCELGRHYSSDFSYSIKSQGTNSVEIQADHASSVRRPGKLNFNLMRSTMQAYHKAMIEGIARLSSQQAVSVEAAGTETSDARFVYHARWSE